MLSLMWDESYRLQFGMSHTVFIVGQDIMCLMWDEL